MRAKIIADDRQVEITEEIDGQVVTAQYWVPQNGGYVRDGDGQQVCAGLSNRGNTLHWAPDVDRITFADLIRRERLRWKRAEARREAK